MMTSKTLVNSTVRHALELAQIAANAVKNAQHASTAQYPDSCDALIETYARMAQDAQTLANVVRRDLLDIIASDLDACLCVDMARLVRMQASRAMSPDALTLLDIAAGIMHNHAVVTIGTGDADDQRIAHHVNMLSCALQEFVGGARKLARGVAL